MGTVMIRCPQTGASISTGYRAERDAFARTPVFFAVAFCAACRGEHEWFAKDAWVQEGRVTHPQPRCEAA